MTNKKWLILMKEEGEGCDYTIGCGIEFKMFDAANKAEASDHAREILDDLGMLNPKSEHKLEACYLFPLDKAVPVPAQKWIIARRIEEIEQQERDQLEALKRKYE